jgi:apolipoprotein N-acyltransferase
MSARPRANASTTNEARIAARGGRATLGLGLAGALLCYLAHPPAGLSLLAWIGPVPWLLLARLTRLPGRRPYRAVWLAGMAYWAATIQWIRLPHWANHFGLVFLALYLGGYLPAFLALTRVGVWRLRLPLWLAAPLVWTGLEWVRARLLTGFLMASLAHTQVRHTAVIQIADVFGEYGVTFLIMLVAGCLASAVPVAWLERIGDLDLSRSEFRPETAAVFGWRSALRLVPGIAALLATLGYGYWRLNQTAGEGRPGPTIALIQSDMLADWKGDADSDAAAMRDMDALSERAVAAAGKRVDLVVWPETMYRDPLVSRDETNGPPIETINPAAFNAREELTQRAIRFKAALLVGIDRLNLLAPEGSAPSAQFRIEGYNSAVLVDRDGKMVGTYDKMHLLPFGEFIPLAEWLPWLLKISPVTGTSIPGRLPEPLFLGDVQYNVNICYETVLPQLIRQQFVHAIQQASASPDVMVNLTNDAWYWGSSELDMHLASGVFRTIETRTPLVIAANRGLTAYVDYMGRVVETTERDKPAFLIADVRLPTRSGVYPTAFVAYGDWFALVCAVSCAAMAVAGWGYRRGRVVQRE